MGLLASAKATLLDGEFAKRDQLPLTALALGISAVCVAIAVSGVEGSALHAVTGLSGALLAIFAAKLGLDKKERKQLADKLEKLEKGDA